MIFDVAIVSYNTDSYLHGLLASLRDVLLPERIGTVHVWDNASSDDTAPLLDAFEAEVPWLRPHRSPVNVHHGPALDRLLREHCATDWVLLLDADTEIGRDFVPAVLPLLDAVPAFVGQIHPRLPQLYAYLAHLLVHRPTYLGLPGFRHDGAPGVAFFREIERTRRPYARFRWSDFVAHAGQAALRGVYARSETTNEFYEFAARCLAGAPSEPDRDAREERLRGRLHRFLASRGYRSGSRPARALRADGSTAALPPRPARRLTTRAWPRRLEAAVSGAAEAAPWYRVHRARRIGLVQRSAEIRRLVRIVGRLRPRRVLEIGTAYGGSLYLWTRAAADDATIVSVDLPPWERDDPWEVEKVREFRGFARRGQHVVTLRADSHDPSTGAAVRRALDGAPLDFLFIDGDHTYEGARADLLDYGSLVRPGGLIALHDIHPHSKGWGGEVPRLWREVARTCRFQELIADPDQDGFGIGVLRP